MKFIIAATLGLFAISQDVSAQELRVQGTAQLDRKSGNMFSGSTDSRFKSRNADTSATATPWKKFYDQGRSMMPGTLLDNRSESDGFIHNGQKFFIRNARPLIEPKPVMPGSMIHHCE